jgi:hypothetical protein
MLIIIVHNWMFLDFLDILLLFPFGRQIINAIDNLDNFHQTGKKGSQGKGVYFNLKKKSRKMQRVMGLWHTKGRVNTMLLVIINSLM